MRRPVMLMFLATLLIVLDASSQTVTVGKYTTHEELSKSFLANLRTIPNTKFTLRSSDKAGGTIQAVRLVRNQELGSLFVLVTQQDASTVLVEATFTRNGGWFGGGDPADWARDYAEQLKVLLPDIVESTDQIQGGIGLEQIVPLRYGEPIALGIKERRITIDTVEVNGRPKDEVIERAKGDLDATTKLVVTLTYSNRENNDWKCEYVVTVLDDAGEEIGAGKRTVSLDEGEIGDTHRVGLTMRTADLAKASRLRVQVVPQR